MGILPISQTQNPHCNRERFSFSCAIMKRATKRFLILTTDLFLLVLASNGDEVQKNSIEPKEDTGRLRGVSKILGAAVPVLNTIISSPAAAPAINATISQATCMLNKNCTKSPPPAPDASKNPPPDATKSPLPDDTESPDDDESTDADNSESAGTDDTEESIDN